jgi:hypothetical protein
VKRKKKCNHKSAMNVVRFSIHALGFRWPYHPLNIKGQKSRLPLDTDSSYIVERCEECNAYRVGLDSRRANSAFRAQKFYWSRTNTRWSYFLPETLLKT